MSSSIAARVEEASPSPPPLPPEPIPTHEDTPVDVPINSLGEDDENAGAPIPAQANVGAGEEDEGEWDPSEERLPGEIGSKGKGKRKATDDADQEEEGEGEAKAHPWQAVWSGEKNAWYFWNTESGEVSWTNPLDPSSATAAAAPPLPPGPAPTVAPAPVPRRLGQPPEIDPDLAYLLPPESRGGASESAAQQAMFNSRTGRFTANDYQYSVDHLDEYNRQKRFNSHYFDQDAWERQRAEDAAKRRRDAELGVDSSKQITKKDMERFKKKKQEKRMRSQAWLRD